MSNEGGAEMASRRRTSPEAEPLDDILADEEDLPEIPFRLPWQTFWRPQAFRVCRRGGATRAAPRLPAKRRRSNDGGAEMASRLGPLEDDDLLAEILLRLPPKPSSLPRASLVCKGWRSIATNAAFRHRFRTHHRNSPILGFFDVYCSKLRFTPLLDLPDRIPSERFSLDLNADEFTWSVLDCRHGRVVLLNWRARELLVFEPVSRDTVHILIPPEFVLLNIFASVNAAVLCAAGDDQDHVHGDCHYSPFKVVLVGTTSHAAEVAIAGVYSQETGMWGDLVYLDEPFAGDVTLQTCTLSSNALYWCIKRTTDTTEDGILKFDLDNQRLTVLSRPPADQVQIIRAEDGGIGLAILSYPSFQLWNHMVNCHGVSTWVLRKTVNVETMLGRKADEGDIVGYAEDADTIFMTIGDCFRRLFLIVHLESMKFKKYRGSFDSVIYHPLTNYYTAGTARA